MIKIHNAIELHNNGNVLILSKQDCIDIVNLATGVAGRDVNNKADLIAEIGMLIADTPPCMDDEACINQAEAIAVIAAFRANPQRFLCP